MEMIYLHFRQDHSGNDETGRNTVALVKALQRIDICKGQIDGLTELGALVSSQTLVDCQSKILTHDYRVLRTKG